MKLLEIRSHANHMLIQNNKYPTLVNYFGEDASKLPDIREEYSFLQWSDAIWYDNYYVDMHNTKQSFSVEQLEIISNFVNTWVQPLGQEGNLTIEQQRQNKLVELKKKCDLETSQLTGITTEYEPVSWDKQEQLARNYLANQGSEALALEALAEARGFGETVEELASKIVAKADAYTVAYFGILGKFHKLSKDVELATTSEAIDVIVW